MTKALNLSSAPYGQTQSDREIGKLSIDDLVAGIQLKLAGIPAYSRGVTKAGISIGIGKLIVPFYAVAIWG
jgi:hypothetical protein